MGDSSPARRGGQNCTSLCLRRCDDHLMIFHSVVSALIPPPEQVRVLLHYYLADYVQSNTQISCVRSSAPCMHCHRTVMVHSDLIVHCFSRVNVDILSSTNRTGLLLC